MHTAVIWRSSKKQDTVMAQGGGGAGVKGWPFNAKTLAIIMLMDPEEKLRGRDGAHLRWYGYRLKEKVQATLDNNLLWCLLAMHGSSISDGDKVCSSGEHLGITPNEKGIPARWCMPSIPSFRNLLSLKPMWPIYNSRICRAIVRPCLKSI